ncbi:alpha/beta-hydrolase [Annulohypoxylon maeteangense]|uniref:alpha/beta-hydrolase n=1 Tax=Annulohypoxylon maeteangense TaxID=1927788 RepID=UPI002008CDD5|nr:alpha/beta-hydrolase [Annulohypoxylon maeteangense]KAI0885287.1 alpha/beta-hydrolase [Annulohypoxylon maeteangense]
MAAEVEEHLAPGGADEVKPYKIHFSSKYLDLTKQKLETTRLPHEFSEPKSKDWWEPKSHVEPLIDFWLEQYSWRTQEDLLNTELPQFRTVFSIPSSESHTRIHFIHAHSPHINAIPLLLIPPFPFSSLSFGHLIKLFTEPEDPVKNQPFHLVIPSLPGIAFSDALPNNTPVISSTADILNSLMSRLAYPHYLVTNASSGSASPAEIDFKLVNHLINYYPNSCLGAHLISPPLAKPKLREAPVEWAKWSIASLFNAPILGYRSEDFSALERNGYVRTSKKAPTPAQLGLNQLNFREPNTLSYALCDSPTGLLVFILKTLYLLSPRKKFTPTELINFTQLAWLPGPESALRFWAHCVRHPEEAEKKVTLKPKVGITVFLGDKPSVQDPAETAAEVDGLVLDEAKDSYICPSWANAKYKVVYTNRVAGRSGLLAWERPEVIVEGIRGVAASILKLDPRLRPSSAPTTTPLEQVVVPSDAGAGEQPVSPQTKPTPTLLSPPPPVVGERVHPRRAISGETAVASSESVAEGARSPTLEIPNPAHPVPPTKNTAVEQPDNEG